eukprot:1023957_1
MEEMFDSPVLSKEIQQIEATQRTALKNLELAINAVNESIDLSSNAFDKFNAYSKQVERIKNIIQDTYFRINKLKARVEQHKLTHIPAEFDKQWKQTHSIPITKTHIPPTDPNDSDTMDVD